MPCRAVDNGKAFTDRLFGLRKRAATGEHAFDALCAALDIDVSVRRPCTASRRWRSVASTTG
ncbi:hypothetical protein DR046_23100, partial [Jannaschia formosa]